MPEVIIYTTSHCPYCARAKLLLANKGVEYREIDVSADEALLDRMVAESGRRTVPQIFVDGKSIGGYEELAALDRAGRLEHLLGTGQAAGK